MYFLVFLNSLFLFYQQRIEDNSPRNAHVRSRLYKKLPRLKSKGFLPLPTPPCMRLSHQVVIPLEKQPVCHFSNGTISND